VRERERVWREAFIERSILFARRKAAGLPSAGTTRVGGEEGIITTPATVMNTNDPTDFGPTGF
jgi:hypothetical protein